MGIRHQSLGHPVVAEAERDCEVGDLDRRDRRLGFTARQLCVDEHAGGQLGHVARSERCEVVSTCVEQLRAPLIHQCFGCLAVGASGGEIFEPHPSPGLNAEHFDLL